METYQENMELWEQAARHLSGEMTDAENLEFLDTIYSNPELKKTFAEIKSDWKLMEPKSNKKKVNVDLAWKKLADRIEAENLMPENKKSTNIVKFSPFIRIAAIFVGIFLLTALLYTVLNVNQEKFLTADNYNAKAPKTITLPDGSQVTLNKNSKLIYPEAFESNQRKVTLEGEAFFDIKRNEKQPFVIEANKAEITVLGTSFNVNTKAQNNRVEVAVKTGKVQLTSINQKENKIILTAGEKGTINNNMIEKTKSKNENYLAWKTKLLKFNGENLSEIVASINKVYESNIKISNEITGNYEIPEIVFDNLPLETILELLCSSFHLKFEKNESEIILYENTHNNNR